MLCVCGGDAARSGLRGSARPAGATAAREATAHAGRGSDARARQQRAAASVGTPHARRGANLSAHASLSRRGGVI